MAIFRVSLVLATTLLLSCLAHASDSDRDSRPLRAEEQKAFFPLICQKRYLRENNCAGVIGYPDVSPGPGPVSLILNAIAYGSFTQANADQAYVTYAAPFEPHVDNFGGGILFARAGGKWKLVRWYPGGQMDRCLALPAADVQNMLCLSGYTGQGETDSSVWLQHVPPTNDRDAQAKALTGVLKAQDAREAGGTEPLGNYQCTMKRAKGEAILLSIDDLKRSKAPGFFAQSSVSYASARDANAACRKNDFANVEETKGVVRYKLQGAKVIGVGPAKFAATDY